MDFSQAEERFAELQARIRRGEALSEDQYQEELAKLMVQDDSGVFWSLEPGTGRWLYFNGTEWVPGTPPKPEPAAQTPPPTYSSESSYGQAAAAAAAYETGAPSYSQPTSSAASTQGMESDSVPTYVRSAETEPPPSSAGGIPPRPVREASPLAPPGGVNERPWLPFAFGALVLLLCAIVLFFGVRGLPGLLGGSSAQATATVTEEVAAVLPTATEAAQATPTSAPTDTPEATETPVPVPVTIAVSDIVNVRSGPGKTKGVIAKLPKDTTATAVGRSEDSSWIQIQLPEKTDTGWVSAEVVTVTGDLNTLPVIVPNEQAAPTKASKPSPTETPTG